MKIALQPLNHDDIDSLFAFERDNSAYFERWIPPRPAGYANLATFTAITHELIDEMDTGVAYYGLMWVASEIAGRINLRDINTQCAELGYRVGESFAGKGIASAAVAQLLTIVQDELGITTIDAAVASNMASNNPASHRVLRNNDFVAFPEDGNTIMFAGESLPLQHYRHILAS